MNQQEWSKTTATVPRRYFGLLLSSHSPYTPFQSPTNLGIFGNREPYWKSHWQADRDHCVFFLPKTISPAWGSINLFAPYFELGQRWMCEEGWGMGELSSAQQPLTIVAAFPLHPRICYTTSANWAWQIRALAWCFCSNDLPWSRWCWHLNCQQTSSLALQLEEWVLSHFPLGYCFNSL